MMKVVGNEVKVKVDDRLGAREIIGLRPTSLIDLRVPKL